MEDFDDGRIQLLLNPLRGAACGAARPFSPAGRLCGALRCVGFAALAVYMLLSGNSLAQPAPPPPAGSGPPSDNPAPSETANLDASTPPGPEKGPPDGGVSSDAGGAAGDPRAAPPEAPVPPPSTVAPGAAPPPSTQPAAAIPVPSHRGRIEGTVADAKTGEALIEAQVTVLQTKKRVLTDIDGHYRIDLPPGHYDLRFFAELHVPRRVTKVAVVQGKTTPFDVTLGTQREESIAVQEVVVVAKPDTSTDAVQLVRRQKATTVSDAISAEQIARTPDANASDAVKRVVGATVQDNRYVVIRGLGGRYSLSLLNGVQLPSPDPDLPSAPLDLFPSSLLANLTVVKTFTPDLPGNFAGGALLIETRDYPSHFTLKLRLGTAMDSEATFRQVNSYQGGSLDPLGYDDGTRSLPSAIPRDRPAKDDSFTQDQLAELGRSFSNRWDLWKHRAQPGLGLGATLGDTITVGGRKLGYLTSVSYGDRWSRQQGHLSLVGPRNPDGQYRPSDLQEETDTGTEVAAIGALLNVGYALAPTHRLGFISIYTHSAEKSASEVTGIDNASNQIDRLRLRFLERLLQFNQLSGEHAFASGRLLWNWQGYLAFTAQDEPDTRDLLRQRGGDSVYRIGFGTGTAERTFGELHEVTGGGGTDFTVPLKWIKLKTGGAFTVSPRQSRVRRFHFEVTDDALARLPSDQAFAPGNIRPGAIEFSEVTGAADAFDATRYIYAGYLMADVVRFDRLRVNGGARLEVATTDLTLGNSLGVNPATIQTFNRRDRAVMPAVNASYALTERSNLRAAYGGTVARPHLRELSPTPFFDYVRGRVVSGNPDLAQTYIHNFDFRWETFPSGGEVLAASTFYKQFESPIERTTESAGDGQNLSFRNASNAKEFGLELEARLNGSRLASKLEPFYLGANFSYVISRVNDRGVTRPLQGQSPYVINAELGFRGNTAQLSLLYNVFGKRITEVGTAGLGDVYEQAFHRLDVTWNQRLPQGLNLKLSATNLLNQRVAFRQGEKGDDRGIEIFGYRPGVAALAVLEWSYEEAKQ